VAALGALATLGVGAGHVGDAGGGGRWLRWARWRQWALAALGGRFERFLLFGGHAPVPGCAGSCRELRRGSRAAAWNVACVQVEGGRGAASRCSRRLIAPDMIAGEPHVEIPICGILPRAGPSSGTLPSNVTVQCRGGVRVRFRTRREYVDALRRTLFRHASRRKAALLFPILACEFHTLASTLFLDALRA
jgi:hypothetical protein